MKFLKAMFEEQLQVQLDPAGNALIGESVFPPPVILKGDPTAYEDEYNAWLNDQWLPEQGERLDTLLALHGNRKRFNDLCGAVERNYVVPLVGSGMSVPSGIEAWSGFLRSIRKYSTLPEAELDALLVTAAFEDTADRLASTMPGRLFDERIEHDLRVENPGEVKGSVQYLPAVFSGLVITTNLDDVLEQVYSAEGHTFDHILAGEAIGDYRNCKSDPGNFLLKLHGDARSRDGRVLGKAEYDRAYGPDGVIRRELVLVYQTRSLLCVGCSLGADRTVSLIAEVAAGDRNMPRHYAFLQMPADDAARLAREHFLAERSIFPIWYDGEHDECITALLVGILRHLKRL